MTADNDPFVIGNNPFATGDKYSGANQLGPNMNPFYERDRFAKAKVPRGSPPARLEYGSGEFGKYAEWHVPLGPQAAGPPEGGGGGGGGYPFWPDAKAEMKNPPGFPKIHRGMPILPG